MPGILRHYKAGSIIYFLGDIGENIYILKEGAVSLIYHSVESGEEVRETIQNGEFFGVKSALARRPREETALVLQPSQVLVLTSEEFESLITTNINIITNFLRVFSNQLRKVGKLVHDLMNHEEVGDNEAELFKIGEYYLKNHKYKQALYAFETYLKHYQKGHYAGQARERLSAIGNTMEGKGDGTYADILDTEEVSGKDEKGANEGAEEKTLDGERGSENIDIATKYYDAVSLFSQEKYEEAYRLFKALHTSSSLNEGSREYVPKIEFEMGRCLIAMRNYTEAIETLTKMIKTYPDDENLKDALFNIGIAYKYQGNKEKAASFFNKVLKMAPESPVDRRAKKELVSLKSE